MKVSKMNPERMRRDERAALLSPIIRRDRALISDDLPVSWTRLMVANTTGSMFSAAGFPTFSCCASQRK